jgi:hypothetical protein
LEILSDGKSFRGLLDSLQNNLFLPKGGETWIETSPLYRQWKEPDRSNFRGGRSTLWITGDLGVGKTMTLASVTKELQKDQGTAVTLQLFCGLEKSASSTFTPATTVLCGLLFQLLSHEKDLCSDIIRLDPQATQPVFASQISSLGSALVSAVSRANNKRIFIIVDALDQCNEPEDLLSELRPLIFPEERNLANKVRILFSSRTLMKVPRTTRCDYEHLELLPSLVETAVTEWTTNELESVTLSLGDRGATFREEASAEILRITAGNWLMVDLALGIYREQADWNPQIFQECKDKLEKIGPKLYSHYAETLKKIPTGIANQARKLFMWLTVSYRPLTITEAQIALALDYRDHHSLVQLNNFLGLDFGSSDGVIAKFRPLIRVDSSMGEVGLRHHSVFEFFTSENEDCPAFWRFNPNEAKVDIAMHLIAFIGFDNFAQESPHIPPAYRRCYKKSTSGNHDQSVTNCSHPKSRYENDHCTLNAYPLLKYTATYWARHLNECGDQVRANSTGHSNIRKLVGGGENEGKNLKFISRLHQYFANTRTVSFPRYITTDSILSYFGLAEMFADMQTRPILASDSGSASDQLVMAAVGGHEAIVAKWISMKSIDASSFLKALEAAADRGHTEVVKVLLDTYSSVPNATLGNSLEIACAAGHTEIVDSLIFRGADINHGTDYASPLEAAAYHGHLPVVKLLISKNADLNRHGHSLRGYGSALHSSCSEFHFDVIKALVEAGASLSVVGGPDGTVLQSAAMSGSLMLVKYLFDNNARDTPGPTGSHGSALNAAVEYGFEDIENFLRGSLQGSPHRQPSSPRKTSVQHNDGHLDVIVNTVFHDLSTGRPSAIEGRARRIIMFIQKALENKNRRTLKKMLRLGVETFKLALLSGHEGFFEYLARTGMQTLMMSVKYKYREGTILLANSWVEALLWAVNNSEERRPRVVRRLLEVCIFQVRHFISENRLDEVNHVVHCAIEVLLAMVAQLNPDLLAIYVDVILEAFEWILTLHIDTLIVDILGEYVSEFENAIERGEVNRSQDMAVAGGMALQHAIRTDRNRCIKTLTEIFLPPVRRTMMNPHFLASPSKEMLSDRKSAAVAEFALDIGAKLMKFKEADTETFAERLLEIFPIFITAAEERTSAHLLVPFIVDTVRNMFQQDDRICGSPVSTANEVVDIFRRASERPELLSRYMFADEIEQLEALGA